MVIYTISDLHLPLGIDKPMDIFGKKWENYVERLRENWQATVTKEDVVILGGDFSWATYLDESVKDFEFLQALNGRKILLKGNHDFWWTTMTKLSEFTKSHSFDTISFLQNNSYKIGKTGICGTRGWSIDSLSSAEDKKIYERELIRLRLSLEDAVKKSCERLIVFTHYPPVTKTARETSFHKILEEYGVEMCVYGHLHGDSHMNAFTGSIGNVTYILAAGDYTGFMPVRLQEENHE